MGGEGGSTDERRSWEHLSIIAACITVPVTRYATVSWALPAWEEVNA